MACGCKRGGPGSQVQLCLSCLTTKNSGGAQESCTVNLFNTKHSVLDWSFSLALGQRPCSERTTKEPLNLQQQSAASPPRRSAIRCSPPRRFAQVVDSGQEF